MNKKNLTNLTLITISLILLLSFASAATTTVNYNIRKGIIEDNGNLTNTTVSISNSTIQVYTCQDSGCNFVNTPPIRSENILDDEFTLDITCPSNNLDEKYAFYLFKEGYIGWQHKNIRCGNDGASINYGSVYLSKKRTGFAPLNNFSVYNRVNRNMPIEIDVNVGIDAETTSAIEDTRLTEDISFNEHLETDVFLEIFDENNTMIYNKTRNLDLEYSETRDLSFTYPGFPETGDYKIKLRTEVPDEKIINSETIDNSYDVMVINEGLKNYSYSLLQNLDYSPTFPLEEDEVTVSFNYLSNYINEYGNISQEDMNTSLDAEIYLDGNSYRNFNFNLPGDSRDFQQESFDFMANNPGLYVVNMTASPVNLLGNRTVPISTSISFFVSEENSTTNNETGNETGNETEDGEEIGSTSSLMGYRTVSLNSVCGNNICEIDLGESKFNCPLDCEEGSQYLSIESEDTFEDKSGLGIITWSFISLFLLLVILILLLIALRLRE